MCVIKRHFELWQSYLKVGLCKAPRHRDHGGSERPRDADGGEELRDVGRQPEWNWPVGIQFSGGVIDVEAEVRDVQLPRVLEGMRAKIKSQVISQKTALIHRSTRSHKSSSAQWNGCSYWSSCPRHHNTSNYQHWNIYNPQFRPTHFSTAVPCWLKYIQPGFHP